MRLLLACLCHYGHLFNGLTNRSPRELIAGLIAGYSTNQATYDLRRVRRMRLIRRVPGSQSYQLTDEGRPIAVFFTKTYTPIVNPSSPNSTRTSPPHRQPPPPRPSLARLRTRPQPQNSPGRDRGLKNMTRS